MDFLKKILHFFLGKKGNSSALIDIGDKKTKNKTLSSIKVENNTGNTNIAGNDINK